MGGRGKGRRDTVKEKEKRECTLSGFKHQEVVGEEVPLFLWA